MTKKSSHNDEPKTCVIPGCGKPLPSNTKRPICDWHWDLVKERGMKFGGGVLTVVGGVVMFVKKDGSKIVGEALRKFLK